MTGDPTRAQIEINAHATGTEEVTALAKEINKVAAAEDNLAAAQENVTRKGAAYLAYVKRVQEMDSKTREERMRATANKYGVGAQADPIIDDIINQRTARKRAQEVADQVASNAAWKAGWERVLQRKTMKPSDVFAMEAAERGMTKETEGLGRALVHAGIDGEHSFKHMITSGGVFRELLVLIHESLIMGNWSRFGGSMMVLAERTGVSASIFTAMGVSVLGAAASVAALTAAMAEGEMQSTAFARAMSLTGGFAGITEGQFNQMAASIGEQIPGSVLKARSAMIDLIKTGQFSGQTLESVGRAAVEFSKYSGEGAKQSAAYFAQMKSGVADWAAKANESYHFLTVDQYDQIAALERLGQVQAAEKLVADDFYTHMANTATQNLGTIEKAIYGVTHAISNMWNGLESIGRKSTLQEQVATLTEKKNVLEQIGLGMAMTPAIASRFPGLINSRDSGQTKAEIAAIDKQINALNAQIAAQNAAAAKTHDQDKINQQGIEAQKYWTAYISPSDPESVAIQAAYKERAFLKAALQDGVIPKNDPRYKDDLNIVSGGSIFQQRLKNIQYEYARQTGNYGHDAQLNNIPLADTTRLQTQLSIMQQMAKATHQTELATLKLEIAQGKLKGFSPAEIKQLTDMATRHDQMAALLGQSNLANHYAAELQRLTMNSSKYKQILEQLQDNGRVSQLSALEEVNLQYTQGDLVGLSPDEIKKLRAAATGDDKLIAEITATKRSAAFGTENAFASYINDATNAGQQVRQVWSDTFEGMEDMLTRVLEGGKMNFRDFSRSVVDDLLKMEVQENIMAPLVKLLGGIDGGKNGSGFEGALHLLGGGLSGAESALFGSAKGGVWASISHMFADGGIMTRYGSLQLNKYANGGIANTPQMAIFGEGRGPEAYVPLPDGRSIPVTMKGGAGGGVMNHVTNHITINSDGSTQISTQGAKQMSQAITHAVQQELIRQAQDGGMFSPAGGVFTGGAFQR